jgi:prepilin-type N-terminal cleavage/methylation domain-containing protein
MKLSKRDQGFTLIEILIVIVILLILITLVFASSSSFYKRERNTERENDIKALHSQIESYYAQNDQYPTLQNINDADWRAKNFKAFEDGTLTDPKGKEATIKDSPVVNYYSYQVGTELKDNQITGACDNDKNGDCSKYVVTATYEGEVNNETTFTRQSIN